MTPWTFGITELRQHLYELVALVDVGVDVVITRHRKPVARLLPGDPAALTDGQRLREARGALRKIRRRLARQGRRLPENAIPPLLRATRRRQ